MGSARDGREATTFWMEEDVKEKAKAMARQLQSTMTELINRAVAYYLDHLTEIDEEYAQRITMTKDILEEHGVPQLKDMDDEINSLETRLQIVEDDLLSLKNTELDKRIQSKLDAKLDETIKQIKSLLQSI